jgi:hypothetical protein
MERLTYREAYDKIIEAYFKDEIKPTKARFCFCGTLNNNKGNWCTSIDEPLSELYLPYEFAQMETALLTPLIPFGASKDEFRDTPGSWGCFGLYEGHPGYEDALFSGMCAALEVLKQIHRERGENVDEVPLFTKRNLSSVK